ncbi:hypothetical protein SRABI128_04886 [Microbacterium sp. Bi128]|nr:hypothetical protein SRABI128_04886 [Microbacterium sp. Bi128]
MGIDVLADGCRQQGLGPHTVGGHVQFRMQHRGDEIKGVGGQPRSAGAAQRLQVLGEMGDEGTDDRGEAPVGGHPQRRKLRDAVRRQGQRVPGKHQHHEPGVALEGKRVRAAGVIDGEIPRMQDCLAVVLDQEPGALQLEIELEIALVGLRNQRRRAVDLMARGGDLDECHPVQPAGPHAAAEVVRIGARGGQGNEGLRDQVPPVVERFCCAGEDMLSGGAGHWAGCNCSHRRS